MDTDRESAPFDVNACRIGASAKIRPDDAIAKAVSIAKAVDQVVVVAGLNPDWEGEGSDWPNLALPPYTDDLILRLSNANSNIVVVVQAGSAIAMPWIDQVKAVAHAWYGGNETGNAIADIVYGAYNPSSRLPMTLPRREEDIAAVANFISARSTVKYDEDIWVVNKHANLRRIEPLFPFGHGLSYTNFTYENLQVIDCSPKGASPDDWKLSLRVFVRNIGELPGDHALHFYTCPPVGSSRGLEYPCQSLQGFTKVYNVQAGEVREVVMTLDECE